MLILKVGECSAIFSPHCKQTSAESYYSSLSLAGLLLCCMLSNMDLFRPNFSHLNDFRLSLIVILNAISERTPLVAILSMIICF